MAALRDAAIAALRTASTTKSPPPTVTTPATAAAHWHFSASFRTLSVPWGHTDYALFAVAGRYLRRVLVVR
jgi:hypothetical protein